MLKNKYLLLPLWIFLISFILDKIVMTETLQTYFTKTVSEINYFHKPYLFQELKDYLQTKTLLITFNQLLMLFL
jgi:hypothetical protein